MKSLRPHLERIAHGTTTPDGDEKSITPATLSADDTAFAAWRDFARNSIEPGGERLVAPSATLTPLA